MPLYFVGVLKTIIVVFRCCFFIGEEEKFGPQNDKGHVCGNFHGYTKLFFIIILIAEYKKKYISDSVPFRSCAGTERRLFMPGVKNQYLIHMAATSNCRCNKLAYNYNYISELFVYKEIQAVTLHTLYSCDGPTLDLKQSHSV